MLGFLLKPLTSCFTSPRMEEIQLPSSPQQIPISTPKAIRPKSHPQSSAELRRRASSASHVNNSLKRYPTYQQGEQLTRSLSRGSTLATRPKTSLGSSWPLDDSNEDFSRGSAKYSDNRNDTTYYRSPTTSSRRGSSSNALQAVHRVDSRSSQGPPKKDARGRKPKDRKEDRAKQEPVEKSALEYLKRTTIEQLPKPITKPIEQVEHSTSSTTPIHQAAEQHHPAKKHQASPRPPRPPLSLDMDAIIPIYADEIVPSPSPMSEWEYPVYDQDGCVVYFDKKCWERPGSTHSTESEETSGVVLQNDEGDLVAFYRRRRSIDGCRFPIHA